MIIALNKKIRGQATLEYAILVGIVAAAFSVMAMYVRRAVQGKLYKIEDQAIGKQNTTRASTRL